MGTVLVAKEKTKRIGGSILLCSVPQGSAAVDLGGCRSAAVDLGGCRSAAVDLGSSSSRTAVYRYVWINFSIKASLYAKISLFKTLTLTLRLFHVELPRRWQGRGPCRFAKEEALAMAPRRLALRYSIRRLGFRHSPQPRLLFSNRFKSKLCCASAVFYSAGSSSAVDLEENYFDFRKQCFVYSKEQGTFSKLSYPTKQSHLDILLIDFCIKVKDPKVYAPYKMEGLRDSESKVHRLCRVTVDGGEQCSNNSCRVAYHPLYARAAGLCVELEHEDRLYLLSVDDDEDQCIRLLSFCKKHRQPSNEPSVADERIVRVADERIVRVAGQCSDYEPPPNPSGCARSEPYDYFGRRGRKEPEALAAASSKRLFVENQPYLVGGYCQHGSLNILEPSGRGVCSKFFCSQQRLRTSLIGTSNSILSVCKL